MEAELAACDEGIRLALSWSTEAIDLEMDCDVAVKMLLEEGREASSLVHLVRSIKNFFGERDVSVRKIDRSQNGASHCPLFEKKS
jgi:hypothetical protein